MSLGVKVENDEMDILIKKNTQFPISTKEIVVEKLYETCSPYQKKVDIIIYEGESKYIKNNFYLDKFSLNILNPKEKNDLTVQFKINEKDSILQVFAKEKGSNNVEGISIVRDKRDEKLIEKMIENGIKEKEEEEERKKRDGNNTTTKREENNTTKREENNTTEGKGNNTTEGKGNNTTEGKGNNTTEGKRNNKKKKKFNWCCLIF